ncbi:hypothetical protein [Photobacterium swingsii]|uniref:hypothetical protein n=1 Tax=Photobacterium swingsii TaxID=680026 RepID=UPI00406812F4
MNHLNALRRKLKKRQHQFVADHDFKGDDELLLSQEDLDDAVELNKIISVMLKGQLQFPSFQFNADGQIYSALQEHLPRLLAARSPWDVCFWLFTKQSVTLKRAVSDATVLRGISVEEMLELGKLAAEQTERFAGMPIDAVTGEDAEVFAACVEHLLNPDYREISEVDVDRESFFADQSSKPDPMTKSHKN